MLSTNFTRNNCGGGYTGGTVAYVVLPGTFTSTISQADADQKAVNATTTNGQNYANANGSCTLIVNVNLTSTNTAGATGFNAVFTNVNTSQQYTFPVSSLTGSRTLGTLTNGLYNVTISKSGNTQFYLFGVGNCNNISVGGYTATFNNISINTSTCNIITIDYAD